MFGLGASELMIILVIVIVLFGGSKLPEIGKGIGEAIRNFKKGTKELGEDLEIEEKKLPKKTETQCQNQQTDHPTRRA